MEGRTEKPVLALGEVLVELMPATVGQSMAQAVRFDKFAGGAPATYAAAIVRLGGRAALLTKVGTDAFSAFELDALRAEGVGLEHVQRLPERQIGLCIHECINGQTSLVFYRRDSAASTLAPEDIDTQVVQSAAALHVSGTSMQISPSAAAACLRAIRLAHEAGVVVSFDPNIRNILGGEDTAKAVDEALGLADLITPTLEEAEAITGCSDPFAAARALKERGPKLVAVTLAERGAVLMGQEGGPVLCPGFAVNVVEPTGAGDVHAAATLVGFLQGWGAMRIGRFANAAGAHQVTAMGHLGAALPTLVEVEARLSRES